MTSIVRLHARHRPLIQDHLLRLSPEDRLRRFGSGLKDAGVRAYAQSVDLTRGRLFGLVEGGHLVALAEVFPEGHDATVEAAFTVDAEKRGRGLGTRLMDRALNIAAIEGYRRVVLYIQQANTPMRAVARKHGFRLSLEDGDYIAERQVDTHAFFAGLRAVAPAAA